MKLYFLSYDLRHDKKYRKLYDELIKFNAVRALDSCWYFKASNTNVRNLIDHFNQFMDGDDGLMVVEASKLLGRNLNEIINDL